MSSQQVNAYTLLSSCILAAENAAVRIREIYNKRSNALYVQARSRPISHEISMSSLTDIYGILSDKINGLKIVSEIGSPGDNFAFSYQDRTNTLIDQKYSKLVNENLYLSDVTVFVNPLDAASNLINNSSLSTVTLMIGVIYQGDPYIGLIMHPFVTPLEPIFAVKDVGEHIPSLFLIPREGKSALPRVLVPSEYKASAPGYEMYHSRGTGYKFSSLLSGAVDIIALRKVQLKVWDILPGIVIISCLNGNISIDNTKELDQSSFWDSLTCSLSYKIDNLPF